MTEPLRRGAFVRVTAEGRTLDAMVVVASTNGRSIAVMFEGILGGHVGMMPLSLQDDGTWRALTGLTVTITTEQL